MTPRSRDRAAMVRIGLIVAAIAAAAFALNLMLFDAAESTGSAGRLSPRAELIAPAGTSTAARTTTGLTTVTPPGATTTTTTTTTPSTSTPTTTDEPDDDSGRGRGRGGDGDGSGRGRGRGGDDD